MYIFSAIFELFLKDMNMVLKIAKLSTFDRFDYLDDY
jgi:hypothetical protein